MESPPPRDLEEGQAGWVCSPQSWGWNFRVGFATKTWSSLCEIRFHQGISRVAAVCKIFQIQNKINPQVCL